MTPVDVCDEALKAFHCVERDGGFFLQGAESAVEVVLLQVLHYEADHTIEVTDNC